MGNYLFSFNNTTKKVIQIPEKKTWHTFKVQ